MSRRLKVNILSIIYILLTIVELISCIMLKNTFQSQEEAIEEAIAVLFFSGSIITTIYLLILIFTNSMDMKFTNKLIYPFYMIVFIVSIITLMNLRDELDFNIASYAQTIIYLLQLIILLFIKNNKKMFYSLFTIIIIILSIIQVINMLSYYTGSADITQQYDRIITYTTFARTIDFTIILYLYGESINKRESF